MASPAVWISIGVGVLLLIGLIILGVWFFFLRGDEESKLGIPPGSPCTLEIYKRNLLDHLNAILLLGRAPARVSIAGVKLVPNMLNTYDFTIQFHPTSEAGSDFITPPPEEGRVIFNSDDCSIVSIGDVPTIELPLEPPTVPPTVPPTFPPKEPAIFPPTAPLTFPPKEPAIFPPTVPPTFPPRAPPTFPPTAPPAFPPTAPPVPPPVIFPPITTIRPPTVPPTRVPKEPTIITGVPPTPGQRGLLVSSENGRCIHVDEYEGGSSDAIRMKNCDSTNPRQIWEWDGEKFISERKREYALSFEGTDQKGDKIAVRRHDKEKNRDKIRWTLPISPSDLSSFQIKSIKYPSICVRSLANETKAKGKSCSPQAEFNWSFDEL